MSELPKVRDEQWDWDFFLSKRKEVLGQWSTGAQLDTPTALEEAIAYHREQPWYKYAALRNRRAEEENRIQIVPQVGHALVEHTLDHMRISEDLMPDRWYVLTDTYTRKGQFAKAAEAVARSKRDGFSYLNGYPVVEHGVAGARMINEGTRAAMGTDNNDEDARLAWEILLAGGWTWGTIKSLEQVIQHSRDYPIENMIENHQYMDRLTGHFTENGVPILRRALANLPGWDTLGFKVTVALVECILAARQGTRFMDLSLGIGMNLVQDVAAMRALKKLAKKYTADISDDIELYPWTYFFLGDWPLNPNQMVGQIAWNAAVSALGGANGMIIKSPDEAEFTPTGDGFRQAIEMAGQVARLVSGQRLPDAGDVALEQEMIELEVESVLARLLELGDGDLAQGICAGVKDGTLDTMFSPWRPLKGAVKNVRDASGAFRYLEAGNVPLPNEVREYNSQKIKERESKTGESAGLRWVIEEATWASRPLLDEIAERNYWND